MCAQLLRSVTWCPHPKYQLVPVVEDPNRVTLLIFPAGHVFPEFKESDAMFAAERVSVPIGKGAHLTYGNDLDFFVVIIICLDTSVAEFGLNQSPVKIQLPGGG